MIGKLTIDKANSNMSYFLYSIKILSDNAGRIARKEFVRTMSDFVGVPHQIDGKENRTLYNKSNFPRYFGFIDLTEDTDRTEILVLTKRGEKLADIISERLECESKDQYYIKPEDQPVFVQMLFESILFDSFGRNNNGSKESRSDVEPPKILFKTLDLLGKATAGEIYYLFYSLNNGVYSSYEDAVEEVKSNRMIGKYNYSAVLEEWQQKNSSDDCKIIKIFTDDSINLLIAEEDEEIGETFYKLNPNITQYYRAGIKKLSPTYSPLQMTIHAKDASVAEQWVSETILGRVGNKECVTEFDWQISQDSAVFMKDILVPTIAKAYNSEKINHYLVIKHADSEQVADLFGTWAPLLVRKNDFTSDDNGFSSNTVEDEVAFDELASLSRNAKRLLTRPQILLPPNFHIVSIESETANMSREYDHVFTQCLINTDADVNTEGQASANIFDGFQPWLTSYNNPDFTGKEKYAGYPKALIRLVGFMEEQGLITDSDLNDLNLDKYHSFLKAYEESEAVREFDETKLSSKAGGAALKKYIKYVGYLLKPHAEAFDYATTKDSGENKIFYGTPGCGKSYYIEYDILGKDKNTGAYVGDYEKENIIRTTFYQDYSNTDFVGQILPKVVKEKEGAPDTVEYIFNPGPFTLALIQAIANPDKKVALVVEEINRGNAPAIFGDIFQLLDRDENGISEYGIKNVSLMDYLNSYTFTVAGLKKRYWFSEIKIPGNMYIYATMNTSDQNVYTLDTAFIRRWDREKIQNTFEKCSFRKKKIPGMDYTWQEFVESINACIASHLEDLQVNEDKQIGAFFIKESLLDEAAEKFAFKVFDYLWNDVAKLDRGVFFSKDYKTLDALIKAYKTDGAAVFKPEIFPYRMITPPQSEANNE